ncbi:hypothetical protein [Endozoicomonas sp. 4G]|uniref:hypothetical protein n=1 Tax=Endozoicomonas sp. 4G TaxID=2872754 RepID=UPI0020785E2C|nr:hypothetical protein [Endozoicomonas sp. 4G]
MNLLNSVTGMLFTPTMQEPEPRTFEELVEAEGLSFNDLTSQEKSILMARKAELGLDKLRALKLEEVECAELEEVHRTRLQKSTIWNSRRIAVTIAKGTGVLVAGAFAAGAASVSIPMAAGVAVCSGVGYLFYLRTHAGELERRSRQLTDFVVTHAQPQRIIREQLELRESERAEALDRRLHQAEAELERERQRKAELTSQLVPGTSDLASGQEHFEEMQSRIERLRDAEQRQKQLDDELRTLTERHRTVDLEIAKVDQEVEQLNELRRDKQDTESEEALRLAQEHVEALESEARTLTEKIKEKDIELETLHRQKNLQANEIQALILQNKAVERDTVKPLQRRLKAAQQLLMEAESAQQLIQRQLFQTQQTVQSLEAEVTDKADTHKVDLESAIERVQFLEDQLGVAIQNKDKNHKEYLAVIDELNAARSQLESHQTLQKTLETQMQKDLETQQIQIDRLRSELEQLQKEKVQLINSSEKVASENQSYREQVDLLTQQEEEVRARWVEAHRSSQHLKGVEKALKAQGKLLEETRGHLHNESSSRKVLAAELNGLKQREATVAKEKALLEVEIQRLQDEKKTDRAALAMTKGQLEEKKNEHELLQESYNRLQEQVIQGKFSNQQLRTELDWVKEEILRRNTEIQKVRDLLQKTKSVLESSKQRVLDLNAEQEAIRSQALQGTAVSAMTHVNQLSSDSVNTKEQLRTVERQKHDLEQQLQSLSSMNQKLRTEAAQFNNKRGQKRKVWQQQINQAKSVAEQSQMLAKSLQQELISRNASVDEMSDRLRQVEEAFDQVSEQLNIQKQEANAVSIQLESSKIESEARKLKLEEVERSIAKLQFSLDSLTGELEVLSLKPAGTDKTVGTDKEAHQRAMAELARTQSEVKRLQTQLSGTGAVVETDVQTLPQLKEMDEELTALGEYLQTTRESFQSDAERITQTLSWLKSEQERMAIVTGKEITALKREAEELHEMNYQLKVRGTESQTRTLETQVKLVEALKALNELQKAGSPEEADKFAKELLDAETSLQALMEESKELSLSIMTLQSHPAVLSDVDSEVSDLDQVRSDLSLEEQKSEDYLSQIKALKQLARQGSETQSPDINDKEYAQAILEVVKKYIATNENEAHPGTGLEMLLSDPLDYIYRIEDYDDDDRDWEAELAGVKAPEPWQQALQEEQFRSRVYFKELMALRTYLVAELYYRGLKTKALEEDQVELETILNDYLGWPAESREFYRMKKMQPIAEVDSEDTLSEASGRLQTRGRPNLEWDYTALLGLSDESDTAAGVMPLEYGLGETSSIEDLVKNDMLRQQKRELREVEVDSQEELYQKELYQKELYQEVLGAMAELEEIDRQLEELDLSESNDAETGAENQRAILEQKQQELHDWLGQEDVEQVAQRFR